MLRRLLEQLKIWTFKPRNPEAQYQIVATPDEILLHHPRQPSQIMAWDELQAVLIETNDQGPFATDVYWILKDKIGRLRIPQGAKGEQELLSRLQQLPSFDNEAVIQAMSSSTNWLFVCWRKENSIEPDGTENISKQSS